MSAQNGYYRHPTIHGETIIFVCEDDLWSVPARGGIARRLTSNPGTASFPAFSPDGGRVAFTGRDDGPLEVYVMEAEGGPPRRITWLGVSAQVVGWKPGGKAVLFASDWRKPFMKDVWLHSVPAEGGSVRAIPYGPARAISYEPGGPGLVIGRNSGDPARWKRYRGGTAGTLWIDRSGKGEFSQLIKLSGNLANPMWIGGRIYFLSDHEGYGNLYSCTLTGRGLARHTHHEDYFVRYPSTDGRRIVHHAGADIFLYDPESGGESKVEIRLHSSRSQRNRKFVPAQKYLESHDLHPRGHAITSAHRGGLFTMGLWEGAPLRLGNPCGVRYRLPRWLADGRRIVAVSDEGGEESIAVFTVDHSAPVPSESAEHGSAAAGKALRPLTQEQARKQGSRKQELKVEEPTPMPVINGDFGRALQLLPAPAGADLVALTNQRQELILVDLTTGKSKIIERSPFFRIEGVAWSPDGRWLAYGFGNSNRTSSLHLYDTSLQKITQVTRPDFHDLNPSFDPEGRYLYFLSYRVFDPVYDSLYFDLGFPKGCRPFLVTLKQDTPSPFQAANRALRAPGTSLSDLIGQDAEAKGKSDAQKAKEAKEGKEDKVAETAKEKGPAQVEIDFEGIADRIVALPVPEGVYGRIRGGHGRIFFTFFPVEGSLETTWFDTEPSAKGTLQVYNFDEEKTETVLERVSDFSLSMDSKVLGIRSGNRLRVVPAGFKAEGKTPKDEVGRESGLLDLDRPRLLVDPGQEWRQMFREAWRLQRDQFWTQDMSGIDWQNVHDRYIPLVERVASRAEFSDLLWEMQGELGTSHCYELGGDYRPEPGYYQGFLGADLEFDPRKKVWRITHIPTGDSWDEKRCSPLRAPGINLQVGDEIVEVAGQAVTGELSPHELLVHHAGREVQLTVRSKATTPSKGKRLKGSEQALRRVTVKTLREEYSLRYRHWVEQNRAWVHRQSQGRVGYVHLPNMGPLGYSEFHRYFLVEAQHDGLIIDVRWNGGGHVSQLILEKLLRKRVGYDANRWGQPSPYPSDAPMGPMVALTNEYSGSDGDIFSHSFKLFGLGPLIGKRTWGGVVGIWPRHALVDGTITTQPEFAFWFQDVGWGVENYGTDPDIEVEIKPQDHAAGRDPQMERALREAEKLIRRHKPRIPEFKNRPALTPPRLPREK